MMRKTMALLLAALLMMGSAALAEAFGDMTVPDAASALRTARIRAAGDLMCHKKQLEYALQPDGSYDFHEPYALVADALGNADYTIANLETTIGKYRNKPYSGFPMFNSPEAMLDAVKDAGVDFLTVANNHMLDRYLEGLWRTLDNVEARGFEFGGGNRSPEERDKPVIVEVNGIRIGMYCCTWMTNGVERHCGKAAKEYAVNYLRAATLDQQIQKLKDAGAEVIIAVPHWGQEYRRQPEASTVRLAKQMIAAGVDVILGSHPHMVQPVEYLTVELPDGSTRTGLVAWSMGNFISNMSGRYTAEGIIVDFTIREKQDGTFEVVEPGIVPIYNWHAPRMIQAVPALKYRDDPPEGMSKTHQSRMRATVADLRALMGEGIALLEE